MGFFDRVGSAWDKITGLSPSDVSSPFQAAEGAIGGAYTAASNNAVGHAIIEASDPLSPLKQLPGGQNVFDKADELAQGAMSAVGRSVSTVAQVDYGPGWGDYLSPSAWNQAWNRSETISAGQAFTLEAAQAWGQTPAGDDPFSDDAAHLRHRWFKETWGGRIASGTADFVLQALADPAVIGGKVAKKAAVAREVVKPADQAAVLAAAGTGAETATKRQAQQAKSLGVLLDKIETTPNHDMPALAGLAHSSDAGALSYMFQRIKENNPEQTPEAAKWRREMYSHVLGTTWGNEASKDELIRAQTALASELERLSNAPTGSVANQMLTTGTSGPEVTEYFDVKASAALEAQRKLVKDELSRLNGIISTSGLDEARVIPKPDSTFAANRAYNNINQSFVQNFAGSPVRIVAQQTARRTADGIDLKDVNQGYQDMHSILGQMSHTSVEDKRKLVNSYLSASNTNERGNVIKALRRQQVTDVAAKYGIDPGAAEVIINSGENRMDEIRASLRSRTYSAAEDGTDGDVPYVSLHDPEDDITDVFERPFLQSHLEDKAPVLNPHEVERIFKAHTGNRMLDTIGAGGVQEEVGLLADQFTKGFTGLWKTAALARGAYPIRIQTDSQLRLMVHMETLQYLSALKVRSVAGAKYRAGYLMGKREKGGPLAEMFPQGRYRESLKATLMQASADPRFDFTEDSLDAMINNVINTNGSLADLGEQISNKKIREIRTGDWGKTLPSSRRWVPDYLRAVNHQIANSPTAVALLNDDDIPAMMARLRAEQKTGGRIAAEYRAVGVNFKTPEQWLNTIVENNNHYLPTPEIREMFIRRSADAEKETRPYLHETQVRQLFQGPKRQLDPMPVHGEAYSIEKMGAIQARYRKMQQGFFNFAAEMPELTAARAPLFMHSYNGHVARILEQTTEESLTPERIDALRHGAMKLARRDVGKILFNAADASNLSASMRFLAPFFTAWEDTLTKWGSLLYDNPQALARIPQLIALPNNLDMVRDSEGNAVDAHGHVFDSEGNLITDPDYRGNGQFVLLPKSLTNWVPGPLGDQGKGRGGAIGIRKDSINSVFQGNPWWLPGFGPMVQVPVNKIVRDIFPEHSEDPVMKYVLPYGTTSDSAADQLLPKWAKSARAAFGTNQDFANQYMIFLQQAQIEANHGGPAVDVDKIKNKTRNYFILKAGLDNASPVSIAPNAKFQLYYDKAHEYQSDKSRKDPEADFFRDFPGFEDTYMSLSQNNTGIAATAEAYTDGIKKYGKDIAKNPSLGYMYVGPANAAAAHNDGVYDYELTHEAGRGLNYRGKKNALDALDQVQEEKGWQTWNAFRTSINMELKNRGLYSVTQTGAEDLQWAEQQVSEQLGEANKQWAKARAEQEHGGAGRIIDAANEFMANHKEVAKRSDMQALTTYVQARDYVKEQLALRENSSLLYNPDLKAILDGVGTALAAKDVGFEGMWNRGLAYDDLTDVKLDGNGKVR